MTTVRVMPSPKSIRWDHRVKCFKLRSAAERARDNLRLEQGTEVNGHPVRWRIRPCRRCGGWYIDRYFRERTAERAAIDEKGAARE
jgi:hypothetical protein